MSKHDLKGMDLSKVGANKDVDFTFKEYMDSFGGGSKKAPKFTDLQQLEDFYGPNELIPGLGKNVEQLKVELQPVGLPKGTRVLGDGTIVPEDAPRNIGRVVTGFLDEFFRGATDLDKRGAYGEGLGKIDLDDLSNYKLLPSQQNKLKDLYKSEEETSATSPTTEAVQAFIDQYPELKKIQKDQMLTQSLFGAGQYVATEPIRQAFLNKAAEDNLRRQQRGRVFEELTPSEISKRASEDQARRLAGSQGFAMELQSMADAQRAAGEAASRGIRAPAATFSV